MGYACPVCEVPQRDGEHLANHLAFTAMLREDDHEAWLDEHVPGWGEETPGELAERVTDHAEEAEFDEVFEDTTEGAGSHDHPHGHDGEHDGGSRPDAMNGREAGGFEGMAEAVTDEAVESVIQDAQELTEEMYGFDEEESEEAEEAGDSGADTGDAGENGRDTGNADEDDDPEGNDS
ncbi:DUF5810 domain-containing protein [Halorarum halobium]|uniref:DUF5810 domain-containing protein n=1 Tax=Halorarum halobium TaxID=3075121 RepID=UPI0028ACF347|nr:DUF5810 domain-containing protein [Halobaculum sp. XH14]